VIALRDYQISAIDAMEAQLAADRGQSSRHASVCAACVGAGKSILIGEMARRETEMREGRVLVLAPAMELIEQDAGKVAMLTGSQPGVHAASLGSRAHGDLVVVASVQTLYRKPDACGQFSLILADEAHLIKPIDAGMWRVVLNAQRNADLIGFTGTPWRLESGRIYGQGRLFNSLVVEIPISELTTRGHLVPILTRARDLMRVEKLKVRAGEFDTAEQESAINAADVVKALESHAEGRQSVLVFTPGVESGRKLTAALRHAGHVAAEVYGDTPTLQRNATTDGFKRGEIRFLINQGCLTTGFDAPRTDCVVLLRRTMSTSLLIQMVGRGLRTSPDHKRDCLLLDYAGNFAMHPAIDEITPPPDGMEKESKPVQRKCKACEALMKPQATHCPACGAEAEKQKRDLVFGDPVEMQSSAAYKSKVEDFKHMAETAKRAGYKPIAAACKFKEKHGIWPTPAMGGSAGHPFQWTFEAGKRVFKWR